MTRQTQSPATANQATSSLQAIDTLRPSSSRVRRHDEAQLSRLEASIRTFGMVAPILIDAQSVIINGEACVEAAKRCGLREVPVVRVEHLSPSRVRALRLALNRLQEQGSWDIDQLRVELSDLFIIEPDFNLEVTGWSSAELDIIIQPPAEQTQDPVDSDVPEPELNAVSRLGDLWHLGDHRLLCASSIEATAWQQLMEGAAARMAFSDPPYNVPVKGHVSGLGKVQHREFQMASGEMSEAEFQQFLGHALGAMAAHVAEGGILSICMDWRGLYPLQAAARSNRLDLLNLCVWNKTNGAMGSLYRSKHELVLILKKGSAPHINNVQLGKHGRYRTNVWDYAGANSFGSTRMADLADHPTVKPTALVADAIRDVTNRGDIVIDGFMGSGTTILAAERTGRRGYGIELDPRYVDVAIRRWQEMTGKQAMLADGIDFATVARSRAAAGTSDDEAETAPMPHIRRRTRPLAA